MVRMLRFLQNSYKSNFFYNIKRLYVPVFLLFITVNVLSCVRQGPKETGSKSHWNGRAAKYVFLFIGDGMGLPQINAAENYLKETGADDDQLVFSKFPAHGITTTYALDRFITGSAAAATAMACGHKTTIGTIAMDGSKEKPFKTLAEYAKENGKKVGIISSVSIDHATPAAFYAHQPSRNDYYDIASQLTESGFDFFGGGGAKGQLPSKRKSRPDIIKKALSNGYIIITNQKGFKMLEKGDKVWAFNHTLDPASALFYDIDRPENHLSLQEYTKYAISHLDGPAGFFIMVEGGKIDWACHANDGRAAIDDTLAFGAAVKEAFEFMKKHPDETLIVVTGDHECGGLTLGFAGTKYDSSFGLLKHQRVSFERFNQDFKQLKEQFRLEKKDLTINDVMPLVKKKFGLGSGKLSLSEYESRQLREAFNRSMKKGASGGYSSKGGSQKESDWVRYGPYEPLTVTITHILNQKAGLGWTTYSHTGVPVATAATGIGASLFNGSYDNTDIFKKIMTIAGYEKKNTAAY